MSCTYWQPRVVKFSGSFSGSYLRERIGKNSVGHQATEDARDTESLFELLCTLQKDNLLIEHESQQDPWNSPKSIESPCAMPFLNEGDEGQVCAAQQMPLSPTTSTTSSTVFACSEELSSDDRDCYASPEVALPSMYHVWYRFRRLLYTIRIQSCRPPPYSSSTTTQPSKTKRPQSVVNILESLADLEHFDLNLENIETCESSLDGKAPPVMISATSSPPAPNVTQLKMRRCLWGGWRIRITSASGQNARFRACPDLTSIKAWKDRVYTWSEEATQRVIARSGQSCSSSSHSAKRKPFMRFLCDEDDKNSVSKQTQDDLVACWTAWLWADRVLPAADARCSLHSSKFRTTFSSSICAPVNFLVPMLTANCSTPKIGAFRSMNRRVSAGEQETITLIGR
jgi:hypothetical protein